MDVFHDDINIFLYRVNMEGMLSIFLCQPGAPDNLHLMNLENIKRQGRDERSLAQTFFRIFSRQTDDDVAARKDSLA